MNGPDAPIRESAPPPPPGCFRSGILPLGRGASDHSPQSPHTRDATGDAEGPTGRRAQSWMGIVRRTSD